MEQRGVDGRYAVALLFKTDPKIMPLGNSSKKALIHLRELEKRIKKDDDLRVEYHKARVHRPTSHGASDPLFRNDDEYYLLCSV